MSPAPRAGVDLVNKRPNSQSKIWKGSFDTFYFYFWPSLHWSKEFLVKANGTQEVIELFPCLHHLKSQYLVLFSFCNISFPGKVRRSESHRQHNRILPPEIYCVCGVGGRGGALVFSLVSLRSSVTWAGHRPTDTNSLRELTALTGLRSARVEG